MNKNLILAFAAAAVTLAACGPLSRGVTVWKNETAIVTKRTWTDVSDKEDGKPGAEIVRYWYGDSIFASNYQVYPCGGGFCDFNGEVIAESGTSAKFWLGLQDDYALEEQETKVRRDLDAIRRHRAAR